MANMNLLTRIVRDVQFLWTMGKVQRRIRGVQKPPFRSFPDRIGEQAARHPGREAIFYQDEVWTYGDLDQKADQIAHWMRERGLKRGSNVALLMENRPDYLATWIGITRAGGTAALINTNLVGAPLVHSLKISEADHLILGHELIDAYQSAADGLDSPPEVWVQGGMEGAPQGSKNLDAVLKEGVQTGFVPSLQEKPQVRDDAVYIYTSGTTGNPKAARISHGRLLYMMLGFQTIVNSGAGDRMYIPLPLYHSAGGVVAVGVGLLNGGAVILRKRFSASQFWPDIKNYRATLFQYIGELCRYLLLAPVNEDEQAHQLRAVIGNGLRPEIWQAFQTRFAIPKIVEFYGATEGNLSLVNFDGKPEAIGCIPVWLHKQTPVALVKFDIQSEMPVRGEDGFCIRCKADEPGEALGQIADDPKKPSQRFEGYSGKGETEKKILRDVFEKGDAWFRSGDLLKFDKDGYFYFVDRIGDTFRWKGENVATSEVAEVLSVFPGVQEANVYGVQVPGADGRAGMASLVVEGDLDLKGLRAHVEKNLPVYARPLFLRLQKEMEITGTFKHRKVELVKEGYDPSSVGDPLFFDDAKQNAYCPLTPDLYQAINEGKQRI